MTAVCSAPKIRHSMPRAPGGAVRLTEIVLVAPLAWRTIRSVWSPTPGMATTDSAAPSTGSSTDRTCGARSHRAPLSCRQTDWAYGLPGS